MYTYNNQRSIQYLKVNNTHHAARYISSDTSLASLAAIKNDSSNCSKNTKILQHKDSINANLEYVILSMIQAAIT